MSARGAGRRVALAGLLGAAALLSAGCLEPLVTRDVQAWVASGDTEVEDDSPPRLESEVYSASAGEVRLRAAIGETVALQLVLHSDRRPAGPFDVSVSDLTGAASVLRAGPNVALFRAQYELVAEFRSWYPEQTGRPAVAHLVADRLVPWRAPRGGGPVAISEARNELVWIDIAIPPTNAAGEYRGTIAVTRAGERVYSTGVRLEVLPVALPLTRSLVAVTRVDPRQLLAAHVRWPPGAAEEVRLVPGEALHADGLALVNATMQLLEAHRTNPVLWASFPKYRPAGDRQVEVRWDEYDALVGPWLDGTGFADGVRLELWPIPASLEYPSATRNGGFGSPQYARLLANYVAECQRHFAERGWSDRAVLRLTPPGPLTDAAVRAARHLGDVVRQSETALPVAAHLPARSLRGLGWQTAPEAAPTGVDVWLPPAMWAEPAALAREQQLGRRIGFVPSFPPYSPALTAAAPAVDALALAWVAARYDMDLLWIEQAAEWNDVAGAAPLTPWGGGTLVYPGAEHGLKEPEPSIRLKRLRRSLLDYELLRLLAANGKQLLAERLARQVVPWALTDCAVENLLSCRPSAWPADPEVITLARSVMLDELAGDFAPGPGARQRQIENLAAWGRLMGSAARVEAATDGARLRVENERFQVDAYTRVQNVSDREISGRWTLGDASRWRMLHEAPVAVEPEGQRTSLVTLEATSLEPNPDGIHTIDLRLELTAAAGVAVPTRFALATCAPLPRTPLIDGRLDDWPLALSNSLGDFRLARSAGEAAPARPVVPTQAFVGLGTDELYFAARCTVLAGEAPVWQADNTVPIDGAHPWGQDVLEVMIAPSAVPGGSAADLLVLQIKPSGLVTARRGYRTEPPMNASETWEAGARVAVSVQHDSWNVEVAIPLSSLPPEARRARVWGFNVARLEARRGEYSSWTGARTPWSAAGLGNLVLVWP